MKRYLPILILLCAAPAFAAEPFVADYVATSDGDTFTVKRGSHLDKIRLHWADTPEIAHNRKETDQPFSREALSFTDNFLKKGKVIQVSPRSTSYGRIVADVQVDGKDLALALVQKGLAQLDPRYKPSKALLEAEAAAKKNKKGLWSKASVPPWEWRARTRRAVRR